jgi:hypothetical protein
MLVFQTMSEPPAKKDNSGKPSGSVKPAKQDLFTAYMNLVNKAVQDVFGQDGIKLNKPLHFFWDGDKLKITASYKVAFSAWNGPYELQEKFLPREINGAIKEKYRQDYKAYKVESTGYLSNNDGSFTFRFLVPEKILLLK